MVRAAAIESASWAHVVAAHGDIGAHHRRARKGRARLGVLRRPRLLCTHEVGHRITKPHDIRVRVQDVVAEPHNARDLSGAH